MCLWWFLNYLLIYLFFGNNQNTSVQSVPTNKFWLSIDILKTSFSPNIIRQLLFLIRGTWSSGDKKEDNNMSGKIPEAAARRGDAR